MSAVFKEINLSYLESIADGDREIIKELIVIFLEQIPEFTEGMQSAFEKEDWRVLAGLAHKAKSSVLSMGMNDLGNIDLKNLELIAKTFRIEVLDQSQTKTEREAEELENLKRSLLSYPVEKQEWLKANASKQSMKNIIDKFISACATACGELKHVLEN